MAGHKILHFSYHKCLTAYYEAVMTEFCVNHGMLYRHYNSDEKGFVEGILNRKIHVLSLNNKNIDLSMITEYRGSHFIRDPRDLLISGYHYHKWCDEHWCKNRSLLHSAIKTDPLYIDCLSTVCVWKDGQSYQDYICKLDLESGVLLEMLFRKRHFKWMSEWNYGNHKILEMKYENIINNEMRCFDQLYTQYCFPEEWRQSWLNIAQKHSRSSKKPQGRSHLRDGTVNQWEGVFTDIMKEKFKERYGGLLVQLGYERELSW